MNDESNQTEKNGVFATPKADAVWELLKTTWREGVGYEHFRGAQEGARIGIESIEKALNSKTQMEDLLSQQLDLMRDEFHRIKVISTDTEVHRLCERAVSFISQRVPLIRQRDAAKKLYQEIDKSHRALASEVRELRANVAKLNTALRNLIDHPYPGDLLEIRRNVREVGDEDEARKTLDAYCTEEAALAAISEHTAALKAAREVVA